MAAAPIEVDYAELGRQLLARVNLRGDGSVPAVQRYSPYNAIFCHPGTGAKLFVGNATTAADRQLLETMHCSRIVFCQESDGTCHFEADPDFKYLKVRPCFKTPFL